MGASAERRCRQGGRQSWDPRLLFNQNKATFPRFTYDMSERASSLESEFKVCRPAVMRLTFFYSGGAGLSTLHISFK